MSVLWAVRYMRHNYHPTNGPAPSRNLQEWAADHSIAALFSAFAPPEWGIDSLFWRRKWLPQPIGII
jgi:hypothetical protein